MRYADFIQRTKKELKDPFIIAEAGVNHEGSMDLAKKLIEEAKKGDAHAIKFQTYKASSLAAKDSPSYWDLSKESTKSQFELFQKYDSFWKTEYEELKKHCDSFDIEFMSTPFDVNSAKFLNDLMDVFKISSSDLTNLPFIEVLCQFEKPIILSTGASYLWEILRSVETISQYPVHLCLMHCVLNYPTPDENANLGMIRGLKDSFPDHLIGYSDHTLPGDMKNILYANLLGAEVIEKHFTHDKSLPGNDHYHAMDYKDLQAFWKLWEDAKILLGGFSVDALPDELPARLNARRSLVLKKSVEKGHYLNYNDLTWKRPASGISPSEINGVLGKKVTLDLEEDTILQWKYLE